MYNQYNFEANSIFKRLLNDFKYFLRAEKISAGSIRCYLSDVRHFFSWLENFLIKNKLTLTLNDSVNSNFLKIVSKNINQKVLDEYKNNLLTEKTPLKTINRRLSSLRRFGKFCQKEKWLDFNPFDTLRNISIRGNESLDEKNYYLGEFRNELCKKRVSQATVKNYLSDIKQFLAWTERKNRI